MNLIVVEENRKRLEKKLKKLSKLKRRGEKAKLSENCIKNIKKLQRKT